MSILEGPITTSIEQDTKALGYQHKNAFLKLPGGEIKKVRIDSAFHVVNERNEVIGRYAEISFHVPVVQDSHFVYSIKKKLGMKPKIRNEIKRLKGNLYTEDFYSVYDPKGYVDLECLHTSKIGAKMAKRSCEGVEKYFNRLYFSSEYKEEN